ncbi:MAG: SpaA isopeptide-forming pilin-related protein [Actinomycetaceae bacterium]|nr:SpaA isopeptide-forming pilin-related protein [Actinomycetaceae bacterium]
MNARTRRHQVISKNWWYNAIVLVVLFACAVALVGIHAQSSFADKDPAVSLIGNGKVNAENSSSENIHSDSEADGSATSGMASPKVQEAPTLLSQPLNSGPSSFPVGTPRSGSSRASTFAVEENGPDPFSEKTEIRYGKDENGKEIKSNKGKFAHHKYKVSGDAAVMVKQLRYVADQDTFGYVYVEEMRPELGFKLGKPGSDWYIDSSTLTNRGGTGVGVPSVFEWRGYTILLRGDMKNIYLEFPRPIPLPAGSEIEFIYTGNHYPWIAPPGVGNKPPSANGGLKVPDIPENYVVEPLQSPPDLASCSVSTIYNGSGGNKTPTTLSRQQLGTSIFTDQTTNGWKYNAMAYHPSNGHIYAVSQTLDDEHPGGHLLAIDPSTGTAQDLGEIEGMLDGREYEYITQYPRPFVPKETETRKEKDDKNLISTGFFTPNGEYWVANASTSGSGLMYNIDLETGIAERVKLKRGKSYNFNIPNPAEGDARPFSNDYTFLKDYPQYAWGIVNHNLGITEPYMERINLTDGTVDHFALRDLETITGTKLATGNGAVYGAAWTYGNDSLGFDHNQGGGVYQISISSPDGDWINLDTPGPDGPTFKLLGRADAPSGYNNDGTSCIAPVKPDLAIIKKRVDKETSALKDEDVDVVWTITVTNNGVGDSGGYRIDDVLPERNYTNIKVAVGTGTSCTLRPGTDTEPAAMQCYGDELKEGKSRAITLGAKYNINAECVDNTATVEGIDGEYDGTDGEHPDTTGNNTSTAKCESDKIAIAKAPALDQDPDTAGNQTKTPLTITTVTPADGSPSYKKASGVARYDITITNNTKTAVTLPEKGIKDTLHLPSWIDLNKVTMKVKSVTGSVQRVDREPALDIEVDSDVTYVPSAETPTYVKGKPFTLELTTINGADLTKISMAGGAVLVISVDATVSAPLLDFTHKDHVQDLECASARPSDDTDTNGLFNGVFLQDENDEEFGTKNNYACVEPDLPNTAVSVEKLPRSGSVVETGVDGRAVLSYSLKISNPSDSPNRIDGVFDRFSPPTGVSVDSSDGKVVFKALPHETGTHFTWADALLDPTAPTEHAVSASTFMESAQTSAGFRVLDVIELPAYGSQEIAVSIPVKVDWSEADSNSLGACTQGHDGTFTGGVQNIVGLPEGIVDKDSDSASPAVTNNVACIPLRQRPNLDITLTKFAYEDGEFTTTPLSGAEFTIMQLNGTTYSPVSSFVPSAGNTGTYTADLTRDGRYFLVETKAPEGGYSLLPRAIAFDITRTGGKYVFSLVDPDNDSVLIRSEMPDTTLGNQLVLKVADVKTGELPAAGPGDQRPWVVLTVLIIVAMCGLNYRRRPQKV